MTAPNTEQPAVQATVPNAEIPSVQNNDELLEQVKQIKDGMISKEEAQKLREDNQKLREALINTINSSQTDTPSKSAQELSKEFFDLAHNKAPSIEMAKKALEFRDTVLKENKIDVFMNDDLQKQDPNRGENVANFLKQAIEQANGSNIMFKAFLEENLKEPQWVSASKSTKIKSKE